MSTITTAPINYGAQGTANPGPDYISTDTINSVPVVIADEVVVDPIDDAKVTGGDVHTESVMGPADYLPILWYFSPPGTQTVNAVATDQYLYVGHNGKVYRLGRQKGDELAKQGLPGWGFHEVSVAISEDKSPLIIASGGKLASLDPVSLSISWSKEVPDSNDKIRILLTKDRIYTGSAGTINTWTLNGAHISKQRVTESKSDVRLDICAESGSLVAGVSGRIRAFDLPDLSSSQWDQRVSNKDEPTWVVCGKDAVYASISGWVYQLGAYDGIIHNKQDLSGSAGDKEVSLALDQSSSRLYAGCNGYGICMDASNLETTYNISLPGAGWNRTSVLAIGHTGVFGCKGRVFQLDSTGKVAARNDLNGYGNNDTSLVFCAPDHLWACPDGYVVAMLMLVVP
ncbi:hypothetical protein FBEOM_12089 [Fusarium beomiforme]|uniref:Uncharacterized protein n=1 Tax=Fusarium beomiforme TaxID=44412 RepID=A0A9P5DTR1_9HYPO|nr:hypothetical protein FBEOM_12089 [Fusarium beomiforme]